MTTAAAITAQTQPLRAPTVAAPIDLSKLDTLRTAMDAEQWNTAGTLVVEIVAAAKANESSLSADDKEKIALAFLDCDEVATAKAAYGFLGNLWRVLLVGIPYLFDGAERKSCRSLHARIQAERDPKAPTGSAPNAPDAHWLARAIDPANRKLATPSPAAAALLALDCRAVANTLKAAEFNALSATDRAFVAKHIAKAYRDSVYDTPPFLRELCGSGRGGSMEETPMLKPEDAKLLQLFPGYSLATHMSEALFASLPVAARRLIAHRIADDRGVDENGHTGLPYFLDNFGNLLDPATRAAVKAAE